MIEKTVLSGVHVTLIPLNYDHVQGLYDAGQSSNVWQWLPRAAFSSIEDTHQWVSETLNNPNVLTYVIVDPKTDSIVGSTRFLDIQHENSALEIGYTWLNETVWGSCINPESKLLLLEYAFEKLRINRVQFKTDERNLRSQAALTKLGATREGVLRENMIVRNGFARNSVYYSILAREWPTIKAQLHTRLKAPIKSRASLEEAYMAGV